MVGNHSRTLFVQAVCTLCCEPLWLSETGTIHFTACSFHGLLPPTASLWLGYRRALLWAAAAAPAQEQHRHISPYLMPGLPLWFLYSYFPNSEVSCSPLSCLWMYVSSTETNTILWRYQGLLRWGAKTHTAGCHQCWTPGALRRNGL